MAPPSLIKKKIYFFRYTEEIQKLFNYSSTLEPRVWRVYDYPRRAETGLGGNLPQQACRKPHKLQSVGKHSKTSIVGTILQQAQWKLQAGLRWSQTPC